MEQQTALLVMDMQVSILDRLIEGTATAVIRAVAEAIIAARAAAIPVIYVRAGFREKAPEISADNKFFFASKDLFASVVPEQWLAIHPALAPHPADILVTKRRISAFTGSDLAIVLRAQQLRHLVLTGVSTSGVVLSTVREAADNDYRLTVLSDGCANADDEVHRVLTASVFPQQATVLTVAEWTYGVAIKTEE